MVVENTMSLVEVKHRKVVLASASKYCLAIIVCFFVVKFDISYCFQDVISLDCYISCSTNAIAGCAYWAPYTFGRLIERGLE